MGSLTRFLQDAFAARCPAGWTCASEVPLVDKQAVRRLGFEPRADILLSHEKTLQRIWVEFEVSRADPVANHAKFATAAFLEGLAEHDCFVSMSSRHIARGRAALAAGTAIWMRGLGIPAFQVDLLPDFDESAVKALNGRVLTLEGDLPSMPIQGEIERVIDVSSVTTLTSGHRVHKADNAYTVSLNVRRWNSELQTDDGKLQWGRRRVQYFVFDPASELFAPSKFCAFIPSPVMARRIASGGHTGSIREPFLGMNMSLYSALGESDSRFDGHVARHHLQSRLSYRLMPVAATPEAVRLAFERWQFSVASIVTVPASAQVLLHGQDERT